MGRLAAIIEAFIAGFWEFAGWMVAHLIFYTVAIAVVAAVFYFALRSQ
ncbi:MAG TPA: hypothetical protein VG055_19320 [Planctomycetaceae bacterium]|jgi:hypothetical protein|nr:hypothetical protein [Planctomycetaceae bacterium]